MIYNGKDFSEFGVHVDESKAFGSPEKDYELIEVVGRNGNLSIYNDRFKDIVLSFPCFIRSGFIEKYRNLLAYLNSLNGYQRLETEKEPNHFRKALFTGSVEVQTTPWNQGGFFTINFSTLPQRFLKTGETTTSVSSSSSSVTGNPVQIDNPSGLTALTGLNVDIQPVQSGEGDPSPTNIRPITGHTSATVQRTVDGESTDYTIDLNGTVYGGTLDVLTGVLTVNRLIRDLGEMTWAKATQGYFNSSNINGTVKRPTSTTALIGVLCSCYKEITAVEAYNNRKIGIAINSSNGYVWVNDPQYETVEDFKTALTGQTICYELAEPTTVQLTAQQVSLLTGTNIISTDMSSLTVTIANPAELENPTLFESKPLIRVYGNGTLNVNDIYITAANSPYTYIDIDCELMDCYYQSNNANQYVSFSTTDYVTLRSGMNYFSYSGFTQVEVTPRWFEV